MKKIGIFGGTFDPIHLGHLGLAVEAISELELKQIFLVPSFLPPHKAGEVITEEHIKSIRPGFGLAPKLLSKIIGNKVIQNVQRGTAVRNDLIK